MQFRIISIHNEAPGVKMYSLEPVGNEAFSYIPGQFITILRRDHGREIRRSYSLFPFNGRPAIGLKRIENGALSRWLHDEAEIGTILNCDGAAHGLFYLPRSFAGSAIWLFAAGIGITPIFGILQDALANTNADIVLVYSSHTRPDCVLREELEEMEQLHERRLRIVWLFSDTKNMLRARFSKEFFPVLQREALTHKPEDILSFVCGPARYMWLVRLLLESAGVRDEAIRQERFVPDQAHIVHQPQDKEPHQVRLLHNGETHEFSAAFPDSILRAGRKAGLDLPYSCEAGQCGSCLAYCRSGRVWMSYNEVLTAKDLESGRILTCTGYPVGGDVSIEIPG
jgi:ferredoxin-NADP reductase